MAFHDRVIRLDLMLHFGTCSLHITKRIHKKIEHMSAGTFDNDWCNRIINDLLKWQLTTYFRSVIVFGNAKILEDEKDIFEAAKILGLKYNNDIVLVKHKISFASQ